MKKVLLSLLGLLVGASLFAQNRIATIKKTDFKVKVRPQLSNLKTMGDTLWLMHVLQNPTLWASSNGGYVSGHNGWNDKQKAQQFKAPYALSVTGALYWFGYKNQTSNDPNSFVYAWVADTTGTGKSSTNPNAMAPGNIISSVRILIADVDVQGNMNIVNYPVPYNVDAGGNFFVGLGLDSTTAGDTVALVTNDTLSTPVPDLSWEQWSDGSWYTFYSPDGWGLNVDLAIFPIVNAITVGIDQITKLNDVGFSFYPNPVKNVLSVKYEIPANGKVGFVIYDMKGKKVKSFNIGNQNKGVNSTSLDLSSLPKGTYLIGLTINGRPTFFQKLQKQ